MVLLHIMDLSILIGLAYFTIVSIRVLRIKLIPYRNTNWRLRDSKKKNETKGNSLQWLHFFLAQSTTDAKYIIQTKYYYWFWDIWVKTSETRSVLLGGNGNGGIPCCELCFIKYQFLTRNWTFQLSVWISFPFFFISPHFKLSTKFCY